MGNNPDHLHRMNTFIEHSFTATMVCVLKNSEFSEEDIPKLELIQRKGSKYFPAVVEILEGYHSIKDPDFNGIVNGHVYEGMCEVTECGIMEVMMDVWTNFGIFQDPDFHEYVDKFWCFAGLNDNFPDAQVDCTPYEEERERFERGELDIKPEL